MCVFPSFFLHLFCFLFNDFWFNCCQSGSPGGVLPWNHVDGHLVSSGLLQVREQQNQCFMYTSRQPKRYLCSFGIDRRCLTVLNFTFFGAVLLYPSLEICISLSLEALVLAGKGGVTFLLPQGVHHATFYEKEGSRYI